MAKVPGMNAGLGLPPGVQAREIVIHTEVILRQAQVQVADLGNDRKMVRFLSGGTAYCVPLDARGVESLIQALKGTGLVVAG